MSPRARKCAGFTLVELIVALTLASLAAVLGAVALRAAIDYTHRARNYLQDQEDLRAGLRLLRIQWQSWHPAAVGGVGGMLEFDVTPPVVATAATPRPKRVRWLCLGEEPGKIVLRYEVVAVPPADPGGDGENMLMELEGCQFEYLALRTEEGVKKALWLPQWAGNEGSAPVAVRLSVDNRQGALPPLFLKMPKPP